MSNENPDIHDGELEIRPSDSQLVETDPSIASLMALAVDKLGGPGAENVVTALKELVALKNQEEDRRAEREFAVAMAAFQQECPTIEKNRTTKKATDAGASFGFDWADLDQIAVKIRSTMATHGLSFTWDSITGDNNVEVLCVISHVNGHKKVTSIKGPNTKTLPGNANPAQQHASALSYYMRYSLILALGLTTCLPDTDGNPPPDLEIITEDQAATLQSLIDEVKADKGKFLKFFSIESIEVLPASQFRRAAAMLESKRGQK